MARRLCSLTVFCNETTIRFVRPRLLHEGFVIRLVEVLIHTSGEMRVRFGVKRTVKFFSWCVAGLIGGRRSLINFPVSTVIR
jgi:hypothetical protein